jgi:lycopene cyclase domain-containing protein
MTYFGVLLQFIGPPLGILAALTAHELARNKRVPPHFRTWPAWAILLGHVAIALVYTTPWDNYLVANRVWWYDPSLVTGIVFGWVPIEEYTFFVVQTLVAGLWLWMWMRRMPPPAPAFAPNYVARWISAGLCGIAWAIWLILLLAGWRQGWYMELLVVWFLPPIVLQLAFGVDILWHHRRLVLVGLAPPFVYLCAVDAIAIHSGTWTINPAHTVGLDLFGVLPLEEITFFLLTNVLIVFGMVLMLARESHVRARTTVGKAPAKVE